MDAWWNDYIGIPYEWYGSSHAGCSCWGLCTLVTREVFGRELPNHHDIEKVVEENPRAGLPDEYMLDFRKIPLEDVISGDFLHMWGVHNNRKIPLHVGVITKPGSVLHIEQGAMSVVESYKTNKRAAWRVIGAYRLV